MGAKLAQHLDGSEMAKLRLEAILSTITGELTIKEACQRLGISEARLYQLRTAVLEAGLACLEPRPAGRPPRVNSGESEEIARLKAQLEDAQWEQQSAEVCAALAAALPQVAGDERVKKTTELRRRRKALRNRKKQSARRRKPR
jgi:transposase